MHSNLSEVRGDMIIIAGSVRTLQIFLNFSLLISFSTFLRHT